MCSTAVVPEAHQLLAELIRDMCEALDPGHGSEIVVGPVDFGESGRGTHDAERD